MQDYTPGTDTRRALGLFTLAVLLTVLVGVAPFLPGQDSRQAAQSRLRQFAAGSPVDIVQGAPKIEAVGAKRIGQAKPGTAGIDLGNANGDLELVGLTEEVWISLPDGRQAKMHLRKAVDDE